MKWPRPRLNEQLLSFALAMGDPAAAMTVSVRYIVNNVNGGRFRNEIVVGNGGKQILLDGPSGNAIELFEPVRRA